MSVSPQPLPPGPTTQLTDSGLTEEDKQSLRAQYAQLQGTEGAQTIEALLADASGWAQHFSTVRMTVTTFLAGLAFGIMTTKWDDFSWGLLFAVWVLWFLAFLLLVHFTQLEAQRLVAWRHNLSLIFAKAELWEKVDRPPKDIKRTWLGAKLIMLGRWLLQVPKPGPREAAWWEIYPGRKDGALLIFGLATALLAVLSCLWKTANQHTVGWF